VGYNSTIVICNDVFSEIDKDPAGWWARAKTELDRSMDGAPREFGFGSAANGFWAAANHHADNVSLLMVGGNMVSNLGTFYGRWRHEAEDVLEVIDTVALYMGRNVVRLPDGKMRRRGLRAVQDIINGFVDDFGYRYGDLRGRQRAAELFRKLRDLR
jgi:hypothetical protein